MADYATPTTTIPAKAGSNKLDLDRAAIEAAVPYVDNNDNIIAWVTMQIDLKEDHPSAVRTKVKQAIKDIGSYVGRISGVT